MASGSSAGPSSPPDGVVRSSALAFVAEQALQGAQAQDHGMDTKEQVGQDRMPMPAGLKALCEAYSRLYPDQPNPLQVTTRLKYWLGGHDPLDYISMYWNPGEPEENVPPHWHYVSFGLSDLHGDGRVHPRAERDAASGLGLELTLRLQAAPGAPPPLWPAALLQALARYMFTTGNKFMAGDHISWHAPLEGSGSASRVRHLLVARDARLQRLDTAHGTVEFLQMVGCTGRELRAAQRGSGFDVLQQISADPRCGAGPWLVTRACRRSSARGVRVRSKDAPAPLAGVSARLHWAAWAPPPPQGDQPTATEESPAAGAEASATTASGAWLPLRVQQQIKDALQRGLGSMAARTDQEGHMSTDSFEMSSMERALPDLMQGSWRSEDGVEYLDGVHIMLNAEGASLLPLAIDGRVRHGRHFTWRGGARAVTLLAPATPGAAAAAHAPRAALGPWLQVIIPKELAQDMSTKVAQLARLAETDSESDSEDEAERAPTPSVPLSLAWPEYRLKISVVSDHELL